MPQIMTPEEAKTKTCPFMSGPDGAGAGGIAYAPCEGVGCACWGWVDPEGGEIDYKNSEVISLNRGISPEGDGWKKVGVGVSVQIWRRDKIKGPRRGHCQAMSPNIEVIGS